MNIAKQQTERSGKFSSISEHENVLTYVVEVEEQQMFRETTETEEKPTLFLIEDLISSKKDFTEQKFKSFDNIDGAIDYVERMIDGEKGKKAKIKKG